LLKCLRWSLSLFWFDLCSVLWAEILKSLCPILVPLEC
jgi:hypothetical protein